MTRALKARCYTSLGRSPRIEAINQKRAESPSHCQVLRQPRRTGPGVMRGGAERRPASGTHRRPRTLKLSQNSLSAVQPWRFVAKPAAERRQIVAGGASPRSADTSDVALEGRQKPLLFNHFLSPLRGSCTICRDRGQRRCAARPRLLWSDLSSELIILFTVPLFEIPMSAPGKVERTRSRGAAASTIDHSDMRGFYRMTTDPSGAASVYLRGFC